jgi:predicted secreted hydrolase
MKQYLLILISIISVSTVFAQSWNQYPYEPSGTNLTFPDDEGHHPGEPVEWWYTIGHVTGDVTGTKYTYMLTYFYYPTLGLDGFRIFNLADDDSGVFHAETKATNYPTLSQDHLEIEAAVLLGGTEIWETKRDLNGDLIPFTYHVEATQANGSISMDYEALKRPLILDGTGYFNQGLESYTYYYSQSLLNAVGTMTMDGVTETVTGTAWIDRQWGNFNPSTGEQYEWFCVQLDNGMDFNIWNIFDTENQIPDTSTYRLTSIYVDENTDINTHDFTFHRTAYAYLPDNSRAYSQQWHFVYDDIDLEITTLHNNSEVQLPFRFYEGATSVTGTVGGVPVTGVGFAELLHPYEVPEMQLTYPTEHGGWVGTENITWELLNPDGGREVYYDVEYSLDNKVTYNPIASNLTGTSFEWDGDGIAFNTNCWIKVTGYSIDHTLVGIYEMQDGFTFGYVGIEEVSADDKRVLVYPNPAANGHLTVQFMEADDVSSIDLKDVGGRTLINKTIGGSVYADQSFRFDVSQLPAGIYLVDIALIDGNRLVRKLLLSE